MFRSAIQSWWARAALELVIVCGVLMGSFRLADRYLENANARTLIDWELKPAVMFGCGYGFTQPSVVSPETEAFINRKRVDMSCREFAWGGAPTPAIGIAFANRYSLYGAGLAMRWRGVSWQTLDAYLAFLYGISMVFTYGLFRTAAGRVLSVLGVAAIACSFTLAEILALRDFVKLPCFTALWLALAWVLRRGLNGGAAATLLPMTAAGTLMGMAIGFRMDALVFLPVFIAIAALVVPGFTKRDVIRKAGSVVAFIVMFLVVGRPILTSLAGGSNSAHVVLLGLMTVFDNGLSVEPAPYDIGRQYSDGYAYTVATSHGLLKQGEHLPILLGSPKYDQIGGRLLRELATNFPSDVVTRAIGATSQIFRFPFEWRIRELTQKQPTFAEWPLVLAISEWRSWVYGFFAERELAATLFVLVLASAFNWRLGALGFLAILYFCGYSMLQFSRRHVFHLDVIPVFVVVLALQLPITLVWRIGRQWRGDRLEGRRKMCEYGRQMAIGTAVLFGTIALVIVTVAGLRWWQQRHVSQIINATLASNWEPVTATDEALAPHILANGAPVAAWYELYIEHPDDWKTATLIHTPGVVPFGEEAASQPDLRQQYFKVTLDNRCRQDEVLIGLKYDALTPTYDSVYTRAFNVPVANAPSYLLTPVYYHLGPSWNRFEGFAVPQAQRACVTAIERARDPRQLALPVVSFLLAPDWPKRPLYQQLLARPRITMLGTPVDPLPTDEDAHNSGWRRHADKMLANLAPSLDTWDVSDGVKVTPGRDGNFNVVSNTVPSGYQLVSPPLEVVPGQEVAVQIAGGIISGEICVGILNGTQQKWLLPPSDARVGLVTDTGEWNQVRLVFSNCAHPPGEFTVRAVSFQSFPKK